MKYQLVLQFSESLPGGIDRLMDIENTLENRLQIAEVDGHDFGSGEMNIFIFTDNPTVAFSKIKKIFEADLELFNDMKVAYRDIDEDKFICIWPKDLNDFKVT